MQLLQIVGDFAIGETGCSGKRCNNLIQLILAYFNGLRLSSDPRSIIIGKQAEGNRKGDSVVSAHGNGILGRGYKFGLNIAPIPGGPCAWICVQR